MDLKTKMAIRERLLHYLDTRTTDYAESTMVVDAARYHDPGHFAAEQRTIIDTHPMIVAHTSELTEPGAEVPVAGSGPTLRVRREADGTLSTWLGDEPAHYPVDVFAGLVWTVPTTHAELDMAAYAGPDLIRDVAASRIEDSLLYRKEDFHLAVNWKLVMDGFTDAYHLQFVHPETVGPFFHTNIYCAQPYPGTKNWLMVTARKGIERFRGDDVDYDEFAQYAIFGYNIYPGSMLARAPAHFELWSIRPDTEDPGRCYVTLYFMVPELPATEKAKRFREKNWEVVLAAVRDEDWAMAKTVSESLASGVLDRLVYGRNEKATQLFHGQLDRDLRAGS